MDLGAKDWRIKRASDFQRYPVVGGFFRHLSSLSSAHPVDRPALSGFRPTPVIDAGCRYREGGIIYQDYNLSIQDVALLEISELTSLS
jgi:hypothetical protein